LTELTLFEGGLDPRLVSTARHLADSVTKEQFESVALEMSDLSVEDLVALGSAFVNTTKKSAVLVGKVAYEIRTRTPDGQWGREVYNLAETWEVSDRTIHRWMKQAQELFGFELTPAQRNAQASSGADARQGEGQEPDFVWDDDDEEDGGGFPEGSLTERMNAEAGWGDGTLPSAEYRNEDASASVAPTPMALEPDDTWVAFTAHSIMQEHEGYSEQAAQRSAVARWARKLDEDPLDLLAEIEMIYESEGRAVTEDIVDTLYAAEEARAIVPDEVTGPKEKKPRGAKKVRLAYDQAEALLTNARSLHEYCFVGHRDGKVDDKQIAGMLPHLQSLPHAIKGLTKLAQEAKDRYLAENPPASERIAATQAAEADEDPDY
jgi:hypothetical protein